MFDEDCSIEANELLLYNVFETITFNKNFKS
jgi:hypothetical protein